MHNSLRGPEFVGESMHNSLREPDFASESRQNSMREPDFVGESMHNYLRESDFVGESMHNSLRDSRYAPSGQMQLANLGTHGRIKAIGIDSATIYISFENFFSCNAGSRKPLYSYEHAIIIIAAIRNMYFSINTQLSLLLPLETRTFLSTHNNYCCHQKPVFSYQHTIT